MRMVEGKVKGRKTQENPLAYLIRTWTNLPRWGQPLTVQKSSNTDCNIPLSEQFRIDLHSIILVYWNVQNSFTCKHLKHVGPVLGWWHYVGANLKFIWCYYYPKAGFTFTENHCERLKYMFTCKTWDHLYSMNF